MSATLPAPLQGRHRRRIPTAIDWSRRPVMCSARKGSRRPRSTRLPRRLVAKGTVYLTTPRAGHLRRGLRLRHGRDRAADREQPAAAGSARAAIAAFVTVRAEHFQQHPDFSACMSPRLPGLLRPRPNTRRGQMALDRQTRALQKVRWRRPWPLARSGRSIPKPRRSRCST